MALGTIFWPLLVKGKKTPPLCISYCWGLIYYVFKS